jgi:ubiquinone/menaquinone biosynthesis C-methylase UbiE
MSLARRSLVREIMDDHEPPQAVVDEVYRVLELINRWFGGTRATLARFKSLSRQWEPGARIEVLDVACGGGDLARALIDFGAARGFYIRVTALDISARALVAARAQGRSKGHPNGLVFLRGDVHKAPFRDRGFDYVTCSLFFHHLRDDEVVHALRSFDRLASRGVVINDLVRGWRLYLWSWLVTRPCNEVLRHDGPLSVRKAFRPSELLPLVSRAGMGWLSLRRHFGHRMTLGGERPPSEASSEPGVAGVP